MAVEPLAAPQPLPAHWTGVARLLTGRAHTRFTSGDATRRALRAAGARAATTGTVVHLPTVPSVSDLPLLAHELAHSRRPVQRPRFLLAAGERHDEEERAAGSAAARWIQTTAAGSAESRYPAGRVGDLPVTRVGALLEAARSGTGALATAGSLAALAGGGASATRAPELAVPAGWSRGGGSAVDATGGAAALAELSSSAAGTVAQPDVSSAGGTTPGLAAAGSASALAAPTVAPAAAVDLDRLLETLEDRVLHELERRGGRYQGVF